MSEISMVRGPRRWCWVCLVVGSCAMPAPGESASDKSDEVGASRGGDSMSWNEYWHIGRLIGDDSWWGGSVRDAQFVLHDTGGATSNEYMQEQVRTGRGPLGGGPQLWVNDEGTWTSRPFYSRWRPTATKHEQSIDLLDGMRDRFNVIGRSLWSQADPTERERALDDVFAPLRRAQGDSILTDAEAASEIASARSQLDGSTGNLLTTATWAVQAVLERGLAPGFEHESLLTDYLRTRNERVERAVHIEIAKPAGGCDSVSVAPYGDAIYSQVALEYLRAAHQAGMFPTITTHFVMDAAFEGHCDPRCFDLDRLYREIAALMGHEASTMYGVTPTYGTTWGEHSIWWSESACGAAAPSDRR